MDIDALLKIMQTLRDPEKGCPWDIKQSFQTIAPYTIEEAYEVVDAIEQEDYDALRGELGDLLLQVVFHARIAEEEGLFDFKDVVSSIVEKMIRRHPHVFADQQEQPDWEAGKREERLEKPDPGYLLDDIANNLPAAKLSVKLQKRAASVGFDWPSVEPVFDKIQEEIGEVRHEIESNGGDQRLSDEVGDLLFACTNLARKLKVDPEAALRATSQRFKRRFTRIEQLLVEQGESFEETGLDEMEKLWIRAKEEEHQRKD